MVRSFVLSTNSEGASSLFLLIFLSEFQIGVQGEDNGVPTYAYLYE